MSRHEPVDIPAYYMGTDPINRALTLELDIDTENLSNSAIENRVAVALGADVIFERPTFVPSELSSVGGFRTAEVHAQIHGEKGVVSSHAPRVPLSDIKEPGAIHEVACWPNPDSFDYRIPESDLDMCRSHGVVDRGNGAIFLSAVGLRGMEQFMMDMALNPELCHEILGKITEYFRTRIRRFLESSGDAIDVVDIGDDVAGQSGMLFSLEMWRDFIKPYVEILVGEIHRFGKRALFFGCGGFREIIPDFIDIGIDCAGRMQTEATGNNLTELKRDFGEEICIWGGLDAQHVLIEGNREEATAHTKAVLAAGSANGGAAGFIAGPTHTFTEDTPIENILAVYEEIGVYKNI